VQSPLRLDSYNEPEPISCCCGPAPTTIGQTTGRGRWLLLVEVSTPRSPMIAAATLHFTRQSAWPKLDRRSRRIRRRNLSPAEGGRLFFDGAPDRRSSRRTSSQASRSMSPRCSRDPRQPFRGAPDWPVPGVGLGALAAAEDALARLDERIKVEPDRRGVCQPDPFPGRLRQPMARRRPRQPRGFGAA